MSTLDEIRYRDCPWCGTRSIAMKPQWAQALKTAGGSIRNWSVASCPRCAGVVATEIQVIDGRPPQEDQNLSGALGVLEVRSTPEDGRRQYEVEHLPEDVDRYFGDAQRVLEAGVPDGAAVQLRRTLEAAAAHKGVEEKSLMKSVQELISQGYITRDFGQVLDHVRKLGNLGAHHTDERLADDEVLRALRFTTQVLRNLFEVPGELGALKSRETEAT